MVGLGDPERRSRLFSKPPIPEQLLKACAGEKPHFTADAASLDPTCSLPFLILHIYFSFDNPFLYSSLLMIFVFVMPKIPTYPSRLSENINSLYNERSHVLVWAPSFELSRVSSWLPSFLMHPSKL